MKDEPPWTWMAVLIFWGKPVNTEGDGGQIEK